MGRIPIDRTFLPHFGIALLATDPEISRNGLSGTVEASNHTVLSASPCPLGPDLGHRISGEIYASAELIGVCATRPQMACTLPGSDTEKYV